MRLTAQVSEVVLLRSDNKSILHNTNTFVCLTKQSSLKSETDSPKRKQSILFNMSSIVKKVDDAVQGSFIGRFFEMEERKARFSTELKGAMATFMTMAYIFAVNPRIMADSGGPCVPDSPEDRGPQA